MFDGVHGLRILKVLKLRSNELEPTGQLIINLTKTLVLG